MRAWRAAGQGRLDVVLAVTVVVIGLVEVATGGVQGSTVAAVLVAVCFGAPLAVRRRMPWVTFAVVFGAFVAARLLGVSLDGFLASVLGGVTALYSLTVRIPFRWSVTAFAAAYLVTVVTALSPQPADLLWGMLIVGGTWLAALEIRHRRGLVNRLEAVTAELEASREEQAAAAAIAERAAMARELHDVIAHGLGVIVVQAGAASRLIGSDAAAAGRALEMVQETGREALGDLRRMLDVLHDDGIAQDRSPQPGLADLDALAERMRSTGLAVTLHRDGDARAVPPGLELTVFRIVQEALTNVLKHASARSVVVAVRTRADRLEVDVQDDGRARSEATGTGRGLAGMRARSALYGGSVAAGPTDSGFRVSASFPMEAAR